MLSLFKKEVLLYFGGFTAYVSAAVFVLLSSLFLWFFDNDYNVYNTGNATLSNFFFLAPWFFLFLIPALSMRTLAGEQQNGTLQWLFTQPIKIHKIVLAKFLAIVLVVLFFLALSLVHPYTIYALKLESDSIDFGAMASAYLGLLLLGVAFSAIGIFASSLTKNPVLAYIASVFFGFLLFYGLESLSSYKLLGSYDFFVQTLGLEVHYNQFLKGILDSRSLVYFFALIALFLLLSVQNLEKKK